MTIHPHPSKPHARKSTPKASRAKHAARDVTADNPVSVFLSYKLSNREAAKSLESALKILSRDALKVFFAERIDPSDRWSNEIHENLKNADCLIVLYTDPTEEWDWCLYEAGYFSGCRADHPPRLYCLHPEGFEPPAPLRAYKSVPGTRDGVREFLRSLLAAPLVEGVKPIFPTLFGDDEHVAKLLDDHVQTIQKLIAPYQPNVKRTHWHVPHLEVTVPKDGLDSLMAGQIVGTAHVVLNSAAQELFLRKTEGCPELGWDEFVKALGAGAPDSGEEAKEWLADFLDRARTSIQLSGKVTQMPAFRTLEDGPLFSACLYATDALMNGGVRIHVVFAEERTP